MKKQLSLDVTLRDEATFQNFLIDGTESARSQSIRLLKESRQSPGRETAIYLWGARGAGCSHLLEATCHDFYQHGLSVQYLPMVELMAYTPDSLLDNLENQSLVCIANIAVIQGHIEWQVALFNLYNAMRDNGGLLLVSSDRAPRELNLDLSDLQSRLSAAVVFHLPEYGDAEKKDILRFRALRIGIDLSDEVAGFILSRGNRDINSLLGYLNHLDQVALSEKRRITIPFIKQILGW